MIPIPIPIPIPIAIGTIGTIGTVGTVGTIGTKSQSYFILTIKRFMAIKVLVYDFIIAIEIGIALETHFYRKSVKRLTS